MDEIRISMGIARTFAPTEAGQFIKITKMKEWNPELAEKILRTSGKWRIKTITWWKNFYWNNIRGTKFVPIFDRIMALVQWSDDTFGYYPLKETSLY